MNHDTILNYAYVQRFITILENELRHVGITYNVSLWTPSWGSISEYFFHWGEDTQYVTLAAVLQTAIFSYLLPPETKKWHMQIVDTI